MVEEAKLRRLEYPMHKNVLQSRRELPATALLLETLKALETALRIKGTLAVGNFHPLWFSAETERNVFLWRRGCSLLHAHDYEFWVDVPKLVMKRLAKVHEGVSDNPFTNPSWGDVPMDVTAESSYLEDLHSAMVEISGHAHALSHLGLKLEEEWGLATCPQELVVLPHRIQRTSEPKL